MPGFSTWPEDGYADVVAEVRAELVSARDRAIAAGLDAAEILVDPGLGFHKSASQSYRLLARLGELADVAPLVVGASRKSFLARDVAAPPEARLGHSVAAALLAVEAGAAMVRVHDVRETRQALAVLAATRAEAAR
jgi:dihydropteroate synthase